MNTISGEELIGKTVTMVYKNWKGNIENRKVTVIGFFEGSTPYHLEHQRFMKAMCLSRNEERDFAVKDISALIVD
jgi:hypothetical protein